MQIAVTAAKAHFAEMPKRAEGGQAVVVTWHARPIVRIEGIGQPVRLPCIGTLAGQVANGEGFDAPLDAYDAKIARPAIGASLTTARRYAPPPSDPAPRGRSRPPASRRCGPRCA